MLPHVVWRRLTRRQIYIEWRECLRWEAEERRLDWERRADLYHTAGKTFKRVQEPDWSKSEPDWKRLYPERHPRPAAGPQKNQWELYQELLASGKLAEIQRTRHARGNVPFEKAKDLLKNG